MMDALVKKEILAMSRTAHAMPGHVNLEIWNTHPDRVAMIREESLNDEDVVAVTEIELNVPQAKELIRQLQLAISNLEAKNVG